MKVQSKAELKTLFHQDGKKAMEGIARLFALMDQKKWSSGLAKEVFQWIHSLKSEASFLGYSKVVADAEGMEEQLARFRKALPTEKEWKDFRQLYLTLEKDLGTILKGVELELSPSYVPQVGDLNDFEKVLLKEAKVRGEVLYRIDAEVEDEEVMPFPRLYLLTNTLELRTNVLRITPALETQQKEKSRSCSLLITSSSPIEHLRSWTQINGLKKVNIQPIPMEEFIGEEELPPNWKTIAPILLYRKDSFKMLTLSSHFFHLQELLASCMEEANSPLKQALLEGILQQTGISADLLLKKASQLVSDLASQLGKDVTFHDEGDGHTKIPYRAFEVLNTVMNHLLRNAVDHGIELPEERRRMGKSSSGNIRVSVSKRGSLYWIRVEDDGKGIDRTVILSKTQDGREKELLSLLVQGEVSTKVSPVSGRGIGLQAVHSLMEKLGGSLSLETVPGKGSRFEARFDMLSLKHPVFPCVQGEDKLYVPKVLVEEVFPLTAHSIRMEQEKLFYPLKGKAIPVQGVNPAVKANGGIGILLSIWERSGVLLAETVEEEQWIPPHMVKKDLSKLISFLFCRE
mgnify:CR=1 FL=1